MCEANYTYKRAIPPMQTIQERNINWLRVYNSLYDMICLTPVDRMSELMLYLLNVFMKRAGYT